MTAQRLPSRRAGLIGGLLLWFGVLGGALAWTVHLLAGWSIDELTCAAGSSEVAGMPLRYAIGLTVLIPVAATVAALVVAWRAWRRTGSPDTGTQVTGTPVAGPQGSGLPRAGGVGHALGRARLLALVGLTSNLLFLTIIVLGGVATLVFPPCQR
ncbi:hypothetical protein ACWDV4_24180 [Micromonospora sp. NPDC003197]